MITITKNAEERISQVLLKKKLKNNYFRISVDGGGCQGFSYNFVFDTKLNKEDQIIELSSIKVLIDKTSLKLIDGSKLDFTNDLMGSYFKIENPQASSTCGCGTSFSV
ncbi:MAG: iron-sulfur cluster assembly accessory protein [Rickettsiales bacterium]|nr:iron-sulfur cluster assembly accessory protein [Rickettsiales bacterium]OUV52851.1 MAG: iron-sulfur cluster assembly accessory protein [Rickettsiales bacterium TMED127]|tara:strand:- start:8054 stop:8377 length:324 start_codon:yes stop_codon:yes gene_type:complete